jgi:hypothetical protein
MESQLTAAIRVMDETVAWLADHQCFAQSRYRQALLHPAAHCKANNPA